MDVDVALDPFSDSEVSPFGWRISFIVPGLMEDV